MPKMESADLQFGSTEVVGKIARPAAPTIEDLYCLIFSCSNHLLSFIIKREGSVRLVLLYVVSENFSGFEGGLETEA